MIKMSSADIIAVLRRFRLANEDNVPRHIEHVKFSSPNEKNTLISFRFSKRNFYLLVDEAGEDDVSYVLEQIHSDKQDATGELFENPHDDTKTYGLPFKGKDVYLFALKSTKERLDSTLARRYPNISRSTWQKHIKAGHVTVNESEQLSPKFEVTPVDTIAVTIPEDRDFTDQELPILYLDDNVIVINKPVGVLTHAKDTLNDEFTVADFFRRYCDVGLDTNRPGIVHRLDRDTSGVMIGARNSETATLLQKQFAERKTKKTYLAIVEGHPKEHTAKIELPIGRNPSAPSTFRIDAKGKAATTVYSVIDTSDAQSLVKLAPLTGRTHQLRVHMQYLGSPIIGDRIYSKSPADRLYLHAYQLEVTIPLSTRKVFTAPIPKAFKDKFPNISL